MRIDSGALRDARDSGQGGYVMNGEHVTRSPAGTSGFPDVFSARLAAELGATARAARRARRMTQADLACAIGVSVEFYGRIERGHALPSVATLARWVAALELDLDEILIRVVGRELPDPAPPGDPPQVRRVIRRLRRATPAARALVARLLDDLDALDGGA